MRSSILVVDDESSMRSSLARVLTGSGYSVRVAENAGVALDEVQKQQPDVVMLDICLPDTSGLEVLKQIKRISERVQVIAMTAYANTPDAVEAIKGGAYDYLTKPFNINTVRLLIKKALDDRHAGQVCEPLHHERWHGSACDRMIGASPAMRKVLDIIHRLPADSASHVLTEGETGTGKELVARAIHETSCRGAEPFVTVSCAAIPRDLVESELFGYEQGAFTGARPEGKQGIFERAGGGTVFLDEIGELDLNLQAKLLRVLEAREFYRVGGLKAIKLRARVIAATNRDLKQEVARGRFRPDLYYRLNVVLMTLPPLRDHRADIIPLAETFMREFSTQFGKRFAGISTEAEDLLKNYAWPGNVRELRNVMERVVLMEDGDAILPCHLPGELLHSTAPETRPGPAESPSEDMSLQSAEREGIVRALRRTGGNVVKAARLLGLKRGALRYRMDKYGITKDG